MRDLQGNPIKNGKTAMVVNFPYRTFKKAKKAFLDAKILWCRIDIYHKQTFTILRAQEDWDKLRDLMTQFKEKKARVIYSKTQKHTGCSVCGINLDSVDTSRDIVDELVEDDTDSEFVGFFGDWEMLDTEDGLVEDVANSDMVGEPTGDVILDTVEDLVEDVANSDMVGEPTGDVTPDTVEDLLEEVISSNMACEPRGEGHDSPCQGPSKRRKLSESGKFDPRNIDHEFRTFYPSPKSSSTESKALYMQGLISGVPITTVDASNYFTANNPFPVNCLGAYFKRQQEYPVTCKQCLYSFKSKRGLTLHLKKCKGGCRS